jgi:3,4-dihydroxy 2-butanone 4-phosphate synthase/GTP cyclohydrolase II
MRSVQSLGRREPDVGARGRRGMDFRTFGVGAQILRALGVRRMRVIGAPKQLHALSGFGLEVVEYVLGAE